MKWGIRKVNGLWELSRNGRLNLKTHNWRLAMWVATRDPEYARERWRSNEA